ncbi:Kinesin-like protein KIN-5C [Cryptosporidium felis]|nr:Kinesin-like protein KIN-5C [Cryptosporidium felis]
MKNLKPRLNAAEENGVNVKVIVRCRPLTEQEKKDPGNCNVLQVKPDSKEIVVSHQSLSRKFDSYSTKLFSFDGVCSSFTSQRELFKQYVVPIVDEVLLGFNCTIFAYGQTGTGKTYTMEGDMREYLESNNLELTEHAGIIPRAVQLIFERLESQYTEYGVRVSYLEIYNEELSDLLSDEKLNLRIYDDVAGKRGLNVDRLEEVPVNKAQDILNILSTAVRKRRTAETLLNKSSSRSHCIFTITIHTKETNIDGEDVLKVGKLNLVDLAGSENIQRSGANAVKDRAKEAGMINQSLLTLGRVINALVEHSSYVPYRDSKLTRLLQDSLGGRTKTCIIATITSSSVYLEETLNTLDYAHRAKNIKNMPVVNQKMTKKVMIREMNCEIEKLKQELQCNREKNGVYLPLAQFNEMENRLQSQANEILEMESELQNQHALYREMEAVQASLSEQLSEKSLRVRAGDFAAIHLTKHAKLYREKYQDLYSQMAQSLESIGRLHRKIIGSELFQSCQNSQLSRLQQQLISRVQKIGGRARECQRVLRTELEQDLLPDWSGKSGISHEEITSIIDTGKRLCDNASSIVSDSLKLSLTEELSSGISRATESLGELARLEEERAARLRDEVKGGLADCSAEAQRISDGVGSQLERLRVSNERCQSLISDYRERSRKFETHLDVVFSERLVGSVDSLVKSQQKELDRRLSEQLSGLEKTSLELKSRFCELVDAFVEGTRQTLVGEKDRLHKEVDDLREKMISELESGYLANKNLLRETSGCVEQLDLARAELSRTQSESLENRKNELGGLARSVRTLGEQTLAEGFASLARLRDEQVGSVAAGFAEISELSAASIRTCVRSVSEVIDLQSGSYSELSSCVEDHFSRLLPTFRTTLQSKIGDVIRSLDQVANPEEAPESHGGAPGSQGRMVEEALRDLIQVEDVLGQPNPSSGQTPSRSQTFRLPIVKERCLSPLKYVDHFIEVLPKPVVDFAQLQKAVDPFYREDDGEDPTETETEPRQAQAHLDWKSVRRDDLRTFSVSEFIQEGGSREVPGADCPAGSPGVPGSGGGSPPPASPGLKAAQSSLDSLKIPGRGGPGSGEGDYLPLNDENQNLTAQENAHSPEATPEDLGPAGAGQATVSSTGIPRPGRPRRKPEAVTAPAAVTRRR